MGKKSKIYNFSDEEFINILKQSQSYNDCAKQLGFTGNGVNAKIQIQKRCQEMNIFAENFFCKKKKINNPNKQSTEFILVENSTYTNRYHLKKRLVNENLLDYKCSICGNTGIWNNKPLSLQLDHVNGINNDNRIENLRFLCPNCHSQTTTFAGRNKTTTS